MVTLTLFTKMNSFFVIVSNFSIFFNILKFLHTPKLSACLQIDPVNLRLSALWYVLLRNIIVEYLCRYQEIVRRYPYGLPLSEHDQQRSLNLFHYPKTDSLIVQNEATQIKVYFRIHFRYVQDAIYPNRLTLSTHSEIHHRLRMVLFMWGQSKSSEYHDESLRSKILKYFTMDWSYLNYLEHQNKRFDVIFRRYKNEIKCLRNENLTIIKVCYVLSMLLPNVNYCFCRSKAESLPKRSNWCIQWLV